VADYLPLGARVALGLVLAVSLISKVRGRVAVAAFATSLEGLRLVPERAATPVAVTVLGVEAVVCVLLALPAGAGLIAATGLMALYTAVVGVVLRRGERAPCGCFGSADDQPLGWPQLGRNLFLATLGLIGLVTAGHGAGGYTVAGAGLTVAAAALVALLVIRLDDIVDLFALPTRTPG
jgi:uncharacterized membrane protein YphA (DoxX/SURF4 family)